VPTAKSQIPETEKYRKARDAWATGRRVWTDPKKWFINGRDVNAAAGGSVPANFEHGNIPQVTWRTGKTRVVNAKTPLETAGIAKALDRITEPFMIEAIREMDTAVSAAAFRIWKNWPAYSGLSRSSLALAWGSTPEGIEVRLISMTDYTFKAPPTRAAWADARNIWNAVPATAGERLRARKI